MSYLFASVLTRAPRLLFSYCSYTATHPYIHNTADLLLNMCSFNLIISWQINVVFVATSSWALTKAAIKTSNHVKIVEGDPLNVVFYVFVTCLCLTRSVYLKKMHQLKPEWLPDETTVLNVIGINQGTQDGCLIHISFLLFAPASSSLPDVDPRT